MKNNWTHSIVATCDNKVINVTSRGFDDPAAGFIHNFLGIELNTEQDRTLTYTKTFSEDELYSVLELFTDYQSYKEIEFLKVCIGYLRSNKEIEKIDLTFHNN